MAITRVTTGENSVPQARSGIADYLCFNSSYPSPALEVCDLGCPPSGPGHSRLFRGACKKMTPSIVGDSLQSAHSLHAGAPEPHPCKFESRRVTSSVIVSPKDEVVLSGSHPSPAAPV